MRRNKGRALCYGWRIAAAAACLALSFTAAAQDPLVVGVQDFSRVLETPHPYPKAAAGRDQVVWTDTYAFPAASYIVFQFERFELAPGDWVEIHDAKGGQSHIFRGRGFQDRGVDFIIPAITGDTAVIDLHSVNSAHSAYGYRVDRVSRGYTPQEWQSIGAPGPQAVCGADDSRDALCYADQRPETYGRSLAVVRILMDGVAMCTGWLISCDNRLITNNHCTWDADHNFDSQAELDRMEFQFGYEQPCGGGAAIVDHSFIGGTWLENDSGLDYTLVQAPAAEDPASAYGYYPVDPSPAVVGDAVYIPGHPDGKPKAVALESTYPLDTGGVCRITSTSQTACTGGTGDLGYFCDTSGGSSGSPVVSVLSQKAVGLHHCGTCPNRAVPMQAVWAHNQAGAHPLPPCSIAAAAGSIYLDRTSYPCGASAGITLRDDSLAGAGTQAVEAWSDTEIAPEVLPLTEDPVGSGRFTGILPLAGSPPFPGDGRVAAVHGDILTVRYIDLDDGLGGSQIPRMVTAAVDCLGSVISQVQAAAVTTDSAAIAWTTDEPATSRADYGPAPPPAFRVEDLKVYKVPHSLPVAGLQACTTYRYAVTAADAAGNSTTDDRAGAYYTFTTAGLHYALGPDTVESGPGGWTAAGNWHISACRSSSASHAWSAGGVACLSTYPYPADSSLISPALDLSAGGYRLRFSQWYATESNYDFCTVQISVDGGVSWTDLLPKYSGSSGAWASRDLDLSAWVSAAALIRFRFTADSAVAYEGWYVDDIEVRRGFPCSPPAPVPDGSAGTMAMRVTKGPGPDLLAIQYDSSCPAPNINLLWGFLGGLAGYPIAGAECGLPNSGETPWDSGASSNLWFILVGDNGAGMESSWGTDSNEQERGGLTASGTCGNSSKNLSASCP